MVCIFDKSTPGRAPHISYRSQVDGEQGGADVQYPHDKWKYISDSGVNCEEKMVKFVMKIQLISDLLETIGKPIYIFII